MQFTADSETADDATKLTYALKIDFDPALIPTGNYGELLDLNRRFNHPAARRVLLQPGSAATSSPSAPAPEKNSN